MRAILRASAVVGFIVLTAFVSGRRSSLQAAGPRESMLTPVSWLAQHLKDPNLVILQVGEVGTYKRGHIPGAEAADMTEFVAPMDHSSTAPAGQIMVELPSDEQLRTTLQGFGISDSSRIVIVESDNYFSPSTRIYLTLVHAGLGANTTLLDGGLPAWKAAGESTTTDVPAVKAGSLSPLRTVQVTVDAAYVQAHEKTPGIAILDVRSPAAWEGKTNSAPPGGPQKFGHIPGATSLPLEQLWDDERSALRPEAELERLFAEAGVKPGDTVVAYCYVGQRATATLFAARTLGHPIWLYDGSMEEWVKLNLPLEMPAKKGALRGVGRVRTRG
ncbi:MAG TPA: rhodanese-like domain-containing protein [Vicinamibacterales bacterium]|nr:rhodanese-like domain-containing protein [Vicinamibacterales bacterium]